MGAVRWAVRVRAMRRPLQRQRPVRFRVVEVTRQWEPAFKVFKTTRRRLLQHGAMLAAAVVGYHAATLGAWWAIGMLHERQNAALLGHVWWITAGAMMLIMLGTAHVVYAVVPTRWVVREGLVPLCRRCWGRLGDPVGDTARCPDCGTANDARKWMFRSFEQKSKSKGLWNRFKSWCDERFSPEGEDVWRPAWRRCSKPLPVIGLVLMSTALCLPLLAVVDISSRNIFIAASDPTNPLSKVGPPIVLMMAYFSIGSIGVCVFVLWFVFCCLLPWRVVRSEWIALCKRCRCRLDPKAIGRVRCPKCGTVNDASRWLINREGAGAA